VTTEPARELSLIEMATMLLRHRRTLIVTPVLVLVLALVGLVIRGRRYAAESVVRPQVEEQAPNRLAGVAAQFGLSLPGTSLGDPVKFTAELAKSRDLLREVSQTEYRFATPAGDSLAGDLAALLRVRGATPAETERRAIGRLASLIDVTTSRDAGLVRLRVLTPWPELSVLVNRRVLGLVDTANQVRMQSQAGAERRFVEKRLEEAREELEQAEQAQERFLQQNRQYASSPQLLVEFGRLQRRVDLRQQLYVTLALAYEQARVDEVRDTPQLIVIDQPEGSARPAGSRVMDALMWLLIGSVLGVMLALLQELLRRQRAQDPEGYADLRRLAFGWMPGRRAGEAG
jgi:uncharacterized protein involved in exopolysaccharide biosynthesis